MCASFPIAHTASGGKNLDGSLSNGELRSALQQQLEYYFSEENLARDSYLRSQMDGNGYVPIITIANFDQVKRLTTDKQLVVDVLKDSLVVQVDETGENVRPVVHKRCVLILREIADSTSTKVSRSRSVSRRMASHSIRLLLQPVPRPGRGGAVRLQELPQIHQLRVRAQQELVCDVRVG